MLEFFQIKKVALVLCSEHVQKATCIGGIVSDLVLGTSLQSERFVIFSRERMPHAFGFGSLSLDASIIHHITEKVYRFLENSEKCF